MAYTIDDLVSFLRTGAKAPPTKGELEVLAAQIDKLPDGQRETLLRLLQELAEKGTIKANQRKMNEAYWILVKQQEAQEQSREIREQNRKWAQRWSTLLHPEEEDGEQAEAPKITQSYLEGFLKAAANRSILTKAAELLAPDEDEAEEADNTDEAVKAEEKPPVQAAKAAESRENVEAEKPLTDAMKGYIDAMTTVVRKLAEVDAEAKAKGSGTSFLYRQFRKALQEYTVQISDPKRWAEEGIRPEDGDAQIRQKWAGTESFEDLEMACRSYLGHGKDAPEQKDSPLWETRLHQAENLRELMWCLRGGVDDPAEYARYKLAEKAMQGAGELFRDSQSPETAETGRRILENLNDPDFAKQQKQVSQIFRKKAFRGFTRTMDFDRLCELRREEPAQVVNHCHKLQVEWTIEQMKNTPTVQPPTVDTNFRVIST